MLRKMLLAISAICAWTGVAVAEPVEIWLGLSGCDRTRMPFRLTVMEDGAIRLSGEFTARTLAGTFTTDAVALAHAAWLSDRAPPGETQFGLVGNVDRDAGLMVGTVEGLEHCPAFVAKRIELPPPAQAPALLAKVAPVRNARDTLSMEDCEAYFSWLADGKFIAPAGKGPRVNTALADQARMQAVLGADIYRWRIENRNQIKKLAACRQKFNRSGDPRHKALLQAAQRNGGVVPAPLAQDPNGRGGGQWIFAFMAAHPDIFEELEHLLRLAAAAPDSVLAQSPSAPKGGASPEAAEPAPTAREWVGVLSCGRGGDRYLRVTQSEKGVVVTTGPGLFNLAAPASLLMAGRVTEGQFDLDPTAWLERSNSVLGRAKPIALRATGEAELRLIHGKVEGDADCETFRAYLQTPADLPISPVGILFQSRVDDAACTALGRWLAAGEVDRIGGFRFNTLILDEKAIVEVLGKPLHLWTNDDVNTFRRMTSECRGRLTQSATIEDSTLAGAIEDWTVKPLSTLVSPGRPTDWMHLDLIRVMGRSRPAKPGQNRIRQGPAGSFRKPVQNRCMERRNRARDGRACLSAPIRATGSSGADGRDPPHAGIPHRSRRTCPACGLSRDTGRFAGRRAHQERNRCKT
ncbi:hypothetical protein [Jhaorihella thermophila]|uniref:hypothetical protein n=1 Tax=Jhaorihella thermophila TaxID=488547 RepID=UPI0036218759